MCEKCLGYLRKALVFGHCAQVFCANRALLFAVGALAMASQGDDPRFIQGLSNGMLTRRCRREAAGLATAAKGHRLAAGPASRLAYLLLRKSGECYALDDVETERIWRFETWIRRKLC